MTGQGGGHGDERRDDTPPFPRPAEPQPWQRYPYAPADPQAPVDPHAPVNYPEYPPTYPPGPPPGPPYGYQPPPGYGGAPYYSGAYDPYQGYPVGSQQTNGLAVASLITSLVGVVATLATGPFGVLISIVAIVLGIVALGQIRQSRQQGRGMAIAGITVGAIMPVLTLLGLMFIFTVASFLSPLRGH